MSTSIDPIPQPSEIQLPSVSLLGLRLARVDRHQLLDHMFAALGRGEGGWLVTANLDFLRRYVRDPSARELYDAAEIRVADGMPLVWACRLQGDHLPERVAGSSLLWLLAERAAREGRSIYFLGGTPESNQGARDVLAEKCPGIKLCGGSSPTVASPPSVGEVQDILAEFADEQPDILLVGLGSPKQEHVIRALRPHLPRTWMIGVGISFSFLAGDLKRAPSWMRKSGLEWIHRMAQDPKRLLGRYLVEDLPFAMRLFPHALLARFSRR